MNYHAILKSPSILMVSMAMKSSYFGCPVKAEKTATSWGRHRSTGSLRPEFRPAAVRKPHGRESESGGWHSPHGPTGYPSTPLPSGTDGQRVTRSTRKGKVAFGGVGPSDPTREQPHDFSLGGCQKRQRPFSRTNSETHPARAARRPPRTVGPRREGPSVLRAAQNPATSSRPCRHPYRRGRHRARRRGRPRPRQRSRGRRQR